MRTATAIDPITQELVEAREVPTVPCPTCGAPLKTVSRVPGQPAPETVALLLSICSECGEFLTVGPDLAVTGKLSREKFLELPQHERDQLERFRAIVLREVGDRVTPAQEAEIAKVLAFASRPENTYHPSPTAAPLPPEHSCVVGRYRCLFSFDELAGRRCRHLTIHTSSRPGVNALAQIMMLFGFTPDRCSVETNPTLGLITIAEPAS